MNRQFSGRGRLVGLAGVSFLLVSQVAFRVADAIEPANWRRVGPQVVSILSAAPTSEGELLVGTHRRTYRLHVDRPAWRQLGSGPGGTPTTCLLQTRGPNARVLAGTAGDGLFAWSGGQRWLASSSGMGPRARRIGALASIGQLILCGVSGDGLYRSRDEGASWLRYEAIPTIAEDIGAVAGTKDGRVLWLATSEGRLLRSTNAGRTWKDVPAGRELGRCVVRALLLSDDNGLDVFVATESGLYRTDSGGATLAALSSDALGLPMRCVLDLIRHRGEIWVGGVGGVFSSRSGEAGSWRRSVPPSELDFPVGSSLVSTPRGVVVGTPSDGLFVIDGEANSPAWSRVSPQAERLSTLDVSFVRFDPRRRRVAYAAGRGVGVLVSRDGGRHWSRLGQGLEDPFVTCIAVDPSSEDALWAGGRLGLHYWNGPENGWMTTALRGKDIRAVLAVQRDEVGVLAGVWGEGLFRVDKSGARRIASLSETLITDIVSAGSRIDVGTWGHGVFTSRDAGKSWVREDLPGDPRIHDLELGSDGTLFAATAGQLLERDRSGTWVQRSTEEIAVAVRDPADSAGLFVGGASAGILRHLGRGGEFANLGSFDAAVNSVAIDPFEGRICLLGTAGAGMFRGELDRPALGSPRETWHPPGSGALWFWLVAGAIAACLGLVARRRRNHAAVRAAPLDGTCEVFISSRSSDSNHAREVYGYLEKQGMRCFFAEESLPAGPRSEFRAEIDRALEQTCHMVVVTSSAANARSRWVEHEWSAFVTEQLAGRKPAGKLVVLASAPFNIDELPLSLRQVNVVRRKPNGLELLARHLRGGRK